MIEGVPLTRGHTPYFILGSNLFFLALIHLLDGAYLSKWLNHSETPFKMINYGPRVQRLRNTSGTFYRRQDGVDTYWILLYMEYGKSTCRWQKNDTH